MVLGFAYIANYSCMAKVYELAINGYDQRPPGRWLQ